MLLRLFVSFHVSSELITFLLHILVNKVNALAWFTYWGLVTHLQSFMPPLSLPLSLSLSLSFSHSVLSTSYWLTKHWSVMSNSYFSYTSQLCSFLACTMVELIHLLPSLSWYWLQIYTCKMPNEPTLFETPFIGPQLLPFDHQWNVGAKITLLAVLRNYVMNKTFLSCSCPLRYNVDDKLKHVSI